jgi:hypothetical protein
MLKIYISDILAYNTGFLCGEWLTLPMNKDELAFKVKMILGKGEVLCNDSFHEEYFITDYEFETVDMFSVNEYDNMYTLNEKARLLEDIEESEHKLIKFLLDENIVSSLEEAIETKDEVVVYENYTMRDIVEEYIEENFDLDSLSPLIANNLDYDGMAFDFEMDGCYFKVDSDIFYYVG